MARIVVETFQEFLEGWHVRQEHYLNELLAAKQNSHESRKEDLNDLITRVLSHYRQYYDEKSLVAQQNIFLDFSTPWLTRFECTFVWVGGFKPGLLFRIVKDSVHDLSEEQNERVSRLMRQTKVEERALDEEIARIQESLAAPPLLELARHVGRLVNEETVKEEEEEVLGSLKKGMQAVVDRANVLRTSTLMKVVELLSPVQNVKFLTAVTQLQLRIRSWGLQRDAERCESSSNWSEG
ncbi:unnamed protein product [Dovyalis caffra]|uniref:DOG1 domain-containing protein n=1 Tax=Dovyalis caffra TaxID=77055 RepID=A0AAV1S3T8_9ROSI|nr:unnamed protein product [Dovyalis caffra]